MKSLRFFLRFSTVVLALLSTLSVLAFTGPSYPVPEYDTNPTNDNTWEPDYWDGPSATFHEASVFKGYLRSLGWTLIDAGQVEPASSPGAQSLLEKYSDAFAQSAPGTVTTGATKGLYNGTVHPLPVFGYVDVIRITAYMLVEEPRLSASNTVSGGALLCRVHDDLSPHTGVRGFEKVYPIDTPATVIQMDAANYLAEHGKRPFNDAAAARFDGGQRVPKELQTELAAHFPWKTPKYDFLYKRYAKLHSFPVWDKSYVKNIVEPVYAAVFARHGILITEGEACALFSNCYYSENIFRSGENHYAVDFFARRHNGSPTLKDSVSGKLPDAWLTWLVVKPLVKNAQGVPDVFFYAANTPQSTIAKDMAEYFKDPVNGKSALAGK